MIDIQAYFILLEKIDRRRLGRWVECEQGNLECGVPDLRERKLWRLPVPW